MTTRRTFIDETTGEDTSFDTENNEQALQIQEEPDTEQFIPAMAGPAAFLIDPRKVPLHLRFLPKADTIDDKLAALHMFSDYVETPCVPLKNYGGQIIEVLGAIVYEQGPYMSKKTEQMVPGYFETRLKLAETTVSKLRRGDVVDTVTRNVIVRTSGIRVAELVGGLLPVLGWYDWAGTFRFEVGLDEKTGAIFLRMI